MSSNEKRREGREGEDVGLRLVGGGGGRGGCVIGPLGVLIGGILDESTALPE